LESDWLLDENGDGYTGAFQICTAMDRTWIHSDYNNMKKTYDSTVRRLSLDSSVETYKTYLIGGFMACEFVLGNFFKFDILLFVN
jgi:hypothetical protein